MQYLNRMKTLPSTAHMISYPKVKGPTTTKGLELIKKPTPTKVTRPTERPRPTDRPCPTNRPFPTNRPRSTNRPNVGGQKPWFWYQFIEFSKYM